MFSARDWALSMLKENGFKRPQDVQGLIKWNGMVCKIEEVALMRYRLTQNEDMLPDFYMLMFEKDFWGMIADIICGAGVFKGEF